VYLNKKGSSDRQETNKDHEECRKPFSHPQNRLGADELSVARKSLWRVTVMNLAI
jgi:hypothetical protein